MNATEADVEVDVRTKDQYLRAEELAERMQLHASTLRRWADHGKVPALKFPADDEDKANGRTEWRFDEAAVVAALSNNHVDPWARTGTQGVSKGRRP